uniref:Uncharacterized protein n=1 Tax=Panagrolaimus sp. ES5 TaxID=591445 RepID=A0AC34GNE9_9BILA
MFKKKHKQSNRDASSEKKKKTSMEYATILAEIAVLNNEGIIYFFKTIERKCKRLEDILRSADESKTNMTKKLSNMLMCIKYLYECVSCLYEVFRTG